ncbi:hypothetical protein Ahy_B09g098202 [Arachis hypogaea]|uniref:Uncharacterized protein n=1 Tax=Arachis hypogaea TaxID=3818 RepID=A0A444XRC0_ARAHY|nr:hypothetical protein Ahy_B09g098202 [Arachis hypogaea]
MENQNRSWMYDRTYDQRRGLKPSFVKGLIDIKIDLYTHGFKPNYWIWTEHGEEITTENQIMIDEDIESSYALDGVTWKENFYSYHEMDAPPFQKRGYVGIIHLEDYHHTHTRKEDRTQWADEHSRKTKGTYLHCMLQAKQEQQAAIEASVIDPPPVSEERIWIETVGGKRKGRVYGMGEVRDSFMVRPQVDGPTTTTSTDVLDLRERITIPNREVEQHVVKYRELEDCY